MKIIQEKEVLGEIAQFLMDCGEDQLTDLYWHLFNKRVKIDMSPEPYEIDISDTL